MKKETANKTKREIVISALISSLIITASVGVLVWHHFSDWSPFVNVATSATQGGQGIKVEVETKIPTKTKLEYGTTSIYLNETNVTNTYDKSHSFIVKDLIPEKRHYVRLVAYTENGTEYHSDFYLVE